MSRADNFEIQQRSHELKALMCKVSTYFVIVDCDTMIELSSKDEEIAEIELVSLSHIIFINWVTRPEDSDRDAELLNIVGSLLQPYPTGSIAALNHLAQRQADSLAKSPRIAANNLANLTAMADFLVSWDACLATFSAMPENGHPTKVPRMRSSDAGWELFGIVSKALSTSERHFINSIPPETSTSLVGNATEVYKLALRSSHPEAARIVREHSTQHPAVPQHLTPDAAALEWRFQVLTKFIRSQFMHLRVAAVSSMCNELIFRWKRLSSDDSRTQDQNESNQRFLCYVSEFLTGTGVVDYILGSTCHPEVIQESGNVVGFLMITNTYTATQTDLLWQTVTTSQDPRVPEALVRMVSKIIQFCDHESLAYMCLKFKDLPVGAFNLCIREFFDLVTRMLLIKAGSNRGESEFILYQIYVRLLQGSSAYGQQCSIAFPEIQAFAYSELNGLIKQGLDDPSRETLTRSCLQDMADKTPTTTGSLQALGLLTGLSQERLQCLITKHDLIRLVVEEFGSSIRIAKANQFAPVYCHPNGYHRRRLIGYIVTHFGSDIDQDLRQQLFDLLVGIHATCEMDRETAWNDMVASIQQVRSQNAMPNLFQTECLEKFLPDLPPSCYSYGALAFVREGLIPKIRDQSSTVLDRDQVDLELLWHIILTTPNGAVGEKAICTLVVDIYVDSQLMKKLPNDRAQQAYSSLVARCVKQLEAVVQKLEGSRYSSESGDSDSIVIVPSDDQRKELELKFLRSLQILLKLLQTAQNRCRFAVPDLRSLMLLEPSPVEGELSHLKFQTFDGNDQSDVKPLTIGLKNTCASLLASLRDASGFDNFRIFYRGRAFHPSQNDACEPIHKLGFDSGLILLRKEGPEAPSSPREIKPGTSSLDLEILNHFGTLGKYLSIEERLAEEVSIRSLDFNVAESSSAD